MNRTIRHSDRLEGTVSTAGDKSISHRAALLNSIADGTAHVSNFCVGDDRTSMLGCLRGLGVEIIECTDCDVWPRRRVLRGRGSRSRRTPRTVRRALRGQQRHDDATRGGTSCGAAVPVGADGRRLAEVATYGDGSSIPSERWARASWGATAIPSCRCRCGAAT